MTTALYLLLCLYGLVCIGVGFAFGMLATAKRWRPTGYQPIDRGQGQPSEPPPRKP